MRKIRMNENVGAVERERERERERESYTLNNKKRLLENWTNPSVSKEQRGITLIALVVTVIVLLILAGISIQMLTGENGILKRAGEAKIKSTSANEEEAVKLAVQEALTEGLGTIDKDNLKEALENNRRKWNIKRRINCMALYK